MPVEDFEEIDLRKHLSGLKKRWKVIVSLGIITMIGTLIVNLRTPKLYEAEVVFMITNKPPIKADFTGKIENLDMPEYSIGTYAKLINDPFLADKVITELSQQGEDFRRLTPEQLIGMVRLKDVPGTSLMVMNVLYTNRDQAVVIANTIASSFIKETEVLSDSQDMQQLFTDKLKVWKNTMENSENALRVFNATSNIGILENQVYNLTFNINSYEEKIKLLTAAVKEDEGMLEQVEGLLKEQQQKLVTNKSITNDLFLQQLSKDITKNDAAKLNSLNVSSEELNPVYMNLMQRKVDSALLIADDKQKLASNIEGLKISKKELDAANKELSMKKMDEARLNRDVDLSRDTYKLISQKNDELSIIYGKAPGLIKIVRAAYSPTAPVSPRVRKNTLMGGLGGIALGILLALFLEFINQKSN